MEAKRILPWVQDLNGWMKAATKIGTWYAHEDGCWRLPDSWSATMTKGNLDDATAICEADYIQRCTEFLSLYNPRTHVVVSREAADFASNEVHACYCGHSQEWGRENDEDWHNKTARAVYIELRAAMDGEHE